jgi:hypothetical protein
MEIEALQRKVRRGYSSTILYIDILHLQRAFLAASSPSSPSSPSCTLLPTFAYASADSRVHQARPTTPHTHHTHKYTPHLHLVRGSMSWSCVCPKCCIKNTAYDLNLANPPSLLHTSRVLSCSVLSCPVVSCRLPSMCALLCPPIQSHPLLSAPHPPSSSISPPPSELGIVAAPHTFHATILLSPLAVRFTPTLPPFLPLLSHHPRCWNTDVIQVVLIIVLTLLTLLTLTTCPLHTGRIRHPPAHRIVQCTPRPTVHTQARTTHPAPPAVPIPEKLGE